MRQAQNSNHLNVCELAHMPQLDGLRALAVSLVVAHHYFLSGNVGSLALIGVKLFFVLSGFLITGILLRSRLLAESTGQGYWLAIRQFYIRRFLRIFPLYCFVIAVAFMLNLEPVREILPWLLTYTLNIHMANQGWFVDNFAHFWTLAVEEQFYIFWPWLMFFTPRKWLIPITLAFISLGPLYRAYEMLIGLNGLATYIFTPACLDALCLGALLAVVSTMRYSKDMTHNVLNNIVLPVGLSASIFLYFFGKQTVGNTIYTIVFDFTLALLFCWLIYSAGRGFHGVIGAILESKPLVYMGRISYGIYVYHPFMPQLCRYAASLIGWHYAANGWTAFFVQSVATGLIASLSWRLMEKPLNDLKRFFQYSAVPVRDDSEISGLCSPAVADTSTSEVASLAAEM